MTVRLAEESMDIMEMGDSGMGFSSYEEMSSNPDLADVRSTSSRPAQNSAEIAQRLKSFMRSEGRTIQ